jgi:transcriptional regulator GlxA family with amidase domain
MEQALDDPLPIATIAKQLGIGARALQLQFRAALNTTAQQHYLSLRLLEARRHVTTTSHPLHDIALATGFTSQSSFARAYAKAFGTSARAHRTL